MGKLFFASFLTLGIISSFVAGAVAMGLIYADIIDLQYAIGFTIVINFLLWFYGPAFSDLINKFFYQVRFLSPDQFREQYPQIASIIDQVATEHNFKFPKIGIIADKNPTAFTYGSARFNARIILTEGIFEFLETKEIRAVVAHELAHIVNRDFVVMMIASTLLQILYEIYAVLIRVNGKKAEGTKLVAFASFALYTAGAYLLFYLSRTREYLADEFAASITPPQDLANALIKIAYGIIIAEDDDRTKRLLQSTRHLGILDVKNAKYAGVAAYASDSNPEILSEVMVFDCVSPWAKLIEINSTHPLTGKRIDHLANIAKEQGQPFAYNVNSAIERMKIDKKRLREGFIPGLIMMLLPLLLPIITLFLFSPYLAIGAFGIGLLLQTFYMFPSDPAIKTNILEQMRDPYVSPLRGKKIILSGQVIGRGVPGYVFGEDMMYQDDTGLIFLDYNSAFGGLGDFFFSLTKIKSLFEQPSQAEGWFFRSVSSEMSLRYLRTENKVIKSHPFLWSIIFPIIIIIISLVLYEKLDKNRASSKYSIHYSQEYNK